MQHSPYAFCNFSHILVDLSLEPQEEQWRVEAKKKKKKELPIESIGNPDPILSHPIAFVDSPFKWFQPKTNAKANFIPCS